MFIKNFLFVTLLSALLSTVVSLPLPIESNGRLKRRVIRPLTEVTKANIKKFMIDVMHKRPPEILPGTRLLFFCGEKMSYELRANEFAKRHWPAYTTLSDLVPDLYDHQHNPEYLRFAR